MKKINPSCILLGMCMILLASLSSAQNNEGTIIYEEKVNIHKRLPIEMEAMKASIPEYKTSKHQLTFKIDKSIYVYLKEEIKEVNGDIKRRKAMRFGGRNGGNRYADLSNNMVLATRDLMGKKFLVRGEPTKYKWKLTGKNKQVGSYLCQEATWQDSTRQIVAWFTPMIPFQGGPGDFTGLPGMILHLDINDGEKEITAMEISLGSIDDTLLIKPTEGKGVSQEEYDRMRIEKMEEMKKEYGNKKSRRRGFFRH